MSNTFRFRTPTFYRLDLEQLGLELDSHLPRLFDSHNALAGQAIQAPAINGGFNVQSGTTSVLGSKLGIATGLASVSRVTASIDSAGAATNFNVSANPSKTVQGGIDLYVWMPTGTADTTPIAATSAATVHWWASGTST